MKKSVLLLIQNQIWLDKLKYSCSEKLVHNKVESTIEMTCGKLGKIFIKVRFHSARAQATEPKRQISVWFQFTDNIFI